MSRIFSGSGSTAITVSMDNDVAVPNSYFGNRS